MLKLRFSPSASHFASYLMLRSLSVAMIGMMLGSAAKGFCSYELLPPCINHRCIPSRAVYRLRISGHRPFRDISRHATTAGSLGGLLDALEEEMATLTDNRNELRECFEAARSLYTKRTVITNEFREELEATRRSLETILAEVQKQKQVGAPCSLGPLSAAVLVAGDTTDNGAREEVVLLGSMQTTYGIVEDNPQPAAVRQIIRHLCSPAVLVELDEAQAEDEEQELPPRLRYRVSKVPCRYTPPPTPQKAEFSFPWEWGASPKQDDDDEEDVEVEEGVFKAALKKLAERSASNVRLRRVQLQLWQDSSDERLFDNICCLGSIAMQMRGNSCLDAQAAFAAAAALDATLLLAEPPSSATWCGGGPSLSEVRQAFAARRGLMLEFLRDGKLYKTFETSRQQLLDSTMQSRGGADLAMLAACMDRLELGRGSQLLDAATLQARDAHFASAIMSPEAREVLLQQSQSQSSLGKDPPPVLVALLGAAHLPGVQAKLVENGYIVIPEPTVGWPEIVSRSTSTAAPQSKSSSSSGSGSKPGSRTRARRQQSSGFR